MLAARAVGLGSCITTIHKYRDPQVKKLLGIPAEVETAALIPLGFRSGSSGARRAGRSPKWRTPTAGARHSDPEDHGAGVRRAKAESQPARHPSRRESLPAATVTVA